MIQKVMDVTLSFLDKTASYTVCNLHDELGSEVGRYVSE